MSSWKTPEIDLTSTEILCPSQYSINCTGSNEDSHYNLYLGPIPTYVSLVSCALSCLGSLSIIFSYVFFKELRSGSRAIITFLSIADLVTSMGYMAGDINYLTHLSSANGSSDCGTFDTICSIQSYITTWSQLSSYSWNSALAIYLFLSISFAKNRAASKMIPYCHVISWGLPILIAFPLLLFNSLGFSLYSASNWCFVKDPMVSYAKKSWLNENVMVPLLIARVVPEFLTYVLIIILYSIIKTFVFKMKRRVKAESSRITGALIQNSLNKIDNKLLMIPMAFILLRIWGFIQIFFILSVSKYFDKGCVIYPVYIIHFVLGILEAIGEGGQGWANALLFIVFNSKTRGLICASTFKLCFKHCPCLRFCCRFACCLKIMYKKRRNTIFDKMIRDTEDENNSILSESTIDEYSTGLQEVSADSSRLSIQHAD